jgi:putative colanic acid biosynthesis acetyltransferase WcaF
MNLKVALKTYSNSWYSPGAGSIKLFFWYFTNALFFKSTWLPVSFIKVFILRLFGAKIGKGVTIKPSVNIKYPWFLKMGNDSWIGEEVWIDNLQLIEIGDNVCISQGAMLLTGNHNYSKTTFDLIVKGIILEEGVWIGAKSIVCPGVKCFSHSVLSVSSVAANDMEADWIYQGNPASKVRARKITE